MCFWSGWCWWEHWVTIMSDSAVNAVATCCLGLLKFILWLLWEIDSIGKSTYGHWCHWKLEISYTIIMNCVIAQWLLYYQAVEVLNGKGLSMKYMDNLDAIGP